MLWFSKASTHVPNLKNLGQNHYSTEVNIIELWLLRSKYYIIHCMYWHSLPNSNLSAYNKKGALWCQLTYTGWDLSISKICGMKKYFALHAVLQDYEYSYSKQWLRRDFGVVNELCFIDFNMFVLLGKKIYSFTFSPAPLLPIISQSSSQQEQQRLSDVPVSKGRQHSPQAWGWVGTWWCGSRNKQVLGRSQNQRKATVVRTLMIQFQSPAVRFLLYRPMPLSP